MTRTQRRILRAFLDAPRHELTTAQLCQPDVGGVRFSARIHELRHEHGIEIAREPHKQGGHVYRLLTDHKTVARALAAAASGKASSTSAPEPAPADPPVSLPSEHTAGADSGAESPGQPVVRSSSTASGDDAGLGDPGDGARLFDIDELRERPLSPLRDAEAA